MKKRELGIVAYKCKRCGKIHYPFHDRCLVCKGREFDSIKAEGTPRLLTWTRIYNLPWGFDVRYLTIGVVEFENGVRAMGQVDVDEKARLEIGECLQPTWEPVRYTNGEPTYGLMLRP